MVEQDNIGWTEISATYDPGDTASHSYTVRAVNQCGIEKEYAATSFSACSANPTTVDVTPNGPVSVCTGGSQLLTATPTGGTSLSYQWYRDGLPVGTNSATYNATDSGTRTYNCVVKSSSCPGGVTDVAATGITWTGVPAFAGLQSAADSGSAPCGIALGWNPATPVCGGPVTYSVYRSTTSGFTPSPANRIMSGITGTAHLDTNALDFRTEYFYIVRAVDGGIEDDNLTELSAKPIGGTTTVLSARFEGSGAGWVATKGTPAATQGDFIIGDPVGTITNNGSPCQPEDDHTLNGTKCFYTAENPAANAGINDIDSGEVILTSPVFNGSGYTSLQLDMWRWFLNEDNDDVGDYYILEVSNDDGATWALVEELDGSITNTNYWANVVVYLEDYVSLSATMKIRVRAADGLPTGDLVEVAIDDVYIYGIDVCDFFVAEIFADGFESGNTTGWSATTP